MPNTKHRKKTLEKSQARNLVNRGKRSRMRSTVRDARIAVVADPAAAEDIVRRATAELDAAARTRLIHPNKAARLKSRMAKARNKAAAETK